MDGRCQAALVADESDEFRQVLRGVLTRQLGVAEVVETRSLPDAVERLCQGGDIGLAVIAVDLPGMAGPASLRPLRERRPDLRIAVCSGSQRRGDILRALAGGVHGYVPKGFGAEALARALGAILDGLIFVPPALAEIDAEAEDGYPGAAVPGGAPAAGPLTPRQREVLALLVQGKSNKEIARALSLGHGTVKAHMSALFRSLGATSRSAAAVSGARLLESRNAWGSTLGAASG